MDFGIRPEKRALARALDVTGVSTMLLRAQSAVHRGGYVRVVNYHGTPPEFAASFERQMEFFAEHFEPVGRADLDRFYRDGRWTGRRPGLLITFDDGLRTNHDVAAPLLERHGFPGWFFVPVGFIDEPAARQVAYASEHLIQIDHPYADGRVAMSWDELRALSQRHEVGCHTRTHLRLAPSIAPAMLEDEIIAAREDMTARVGRTVDTFCWVGGEEHTYSAEAARVIRRAGYAYSFMTNNAPLVPGTDRHQIQRTNIEAAWSLDVLRFQLSGVMDALYTPKRARVNRLTVR